MARARRLGVLLVVVFVVSVVAWQLVKVRRAIVASPAGQGRVGAAQLDGGHEADDPASGLPMPVPSGGREAVPLAPVPSAETTPQQRLAEVGVPVHVTARVVDGDGAPVPGARAIWIPSGPTLAAAGVGQERWENSSMILYSSHEPKLPAPGLAALPQALAGADGRVELDARHVVIEKETPVANDSGLPRPTLLVTADGWATRAVPVKALGEGERDLGDIALESEAIATGRTVDDAGAPLAGAEVRLWSQQPQSIPREKLRESRLVYVPELMRVVTGADGRFMLRGLWAGKAKLRLRAPNRVRQQRDLELTGGATLDLGDVIVPAGSSVAGRVVDGAGSPVPDARVLVADGEIKGGMVFDMGYGYKDGDDSIYDEIGQTEAREKYDAVTTDAGGAFRVGGIDQPQLSIYAMAPGFEPARVRPISAGSADVVLQLQPEATLRVAVVDRASHAPLLDASVRVFREGAGGLHSNVELKLQPAGPGVAIAHGAGPQAQRVTASAPGRAEITIAAPGVPIGQAGEFLVELAAESVLAGRVRDSQGATPAGALVAIQKPGEPRKRPAEVPADGEGRFRFEHLGAGDLELVAWAPGWPESAPLAVTLADGERREDLELRLPTPARIAGTWTTADGQPRAGLSVRLDVPPFDGRFKFQQLSPRFETSARCDEQGRYAFEGLRPGTYRVDARSAGAVECTLAEGEQRTVDFRQPAAVRVHGRVTAGGHPVSGAPVKARNDPVDRSQRLFLDQPAVSDADGLYALELNVGGDLEVYVEGSGIPESEPHSVHVEPGGDATLDIELPTGRIAGQIVDDASGAAVEGLEVSLCHDRNIYLASSTTDDAGSFRFEGLPPDAYSVRVSGSGRSERNRFEPVVVRLEPRDVLLAAAATVDDLRFTACRGGRLKGSVRMADGNRISDGLTIQLVRMDGQQIAPGTSHGLASGGEYGDRSVLTESQTPIWAYESLKNGSFTFLALPAGDYRLLAGDATPEEVRDRGQSVRLDEHQVLDVELVTR